MKITRGKTPEENDIVLATIKRVTTHAAFVDLDEYEGAEGLIHISEASKTWVKNMKTHFRENQHVVGKVLEIKKPGFVHISIRRVSDYERREKWDQIRRQKRIENLLEIISTKTGLSFDDIYYKLSPLEKKYKELYFAFEAAKKKGAEFFNDFPEIKKVLWEVVDKNIKLPTVKIDGVLRIISTDGEGIEKIKKMLEGTNLDVSYLSAPEYHVSVSAVDYKEAEKKLDTIINSIKKKASSTETVTFTRSKKK